MRRVAAILVLLAMAASACQPAAVAPTAAAGAGNLPVTFSPGPATDRHGGSARVWHEQGRFAL